MEHILKCVVCGQQRKEKHRCPQRIESARAAAQRRAEEGWGEPWRTPVYRLNEGLAMLENEENSRWYT